MPAAERLRSRGKKRGRRILGDLAHELREARVRAGISQAEVGRRLGMSGDKIWQIENEKLPSLSISDACELAAVLGLDLSARTYPNGAKIRDAGQATRLAKFLSHVGAPLSAETEVALPKLDDAPELRAWDAAIKGLDERTGVEFESRLTDIQAMLRHHNAKRRDDPVDHFLLVVANTRHNRSVLAELGDVIGDLPRLRTANVIATLRNGAHPPTGFILL
jgi:transcriptional regulator with XRE-family HTH domain